MESCNSKNLQINECQSYSITEGWHILYPLSYLTVTILLGFSVRRHWKVSNDARFCSETLDKSVSFFETNFPVISEYEKMSLMRRYKKILLRFKVISRNVGDFLIFFPNFLPSVIFDSK